MGNSIVKHCISGKDRYLVWSSIVDAPITYGITKKQLLQFWRTEYGRSGVEDLERRLAAGRTKTVDCMVSCNRAGKDETRLTTEQIVDYFFVRCGTGDHPEGTRPDDEEDEVD